MAKRSVSPLTADLASAREQGWRIEVVDKRTVRLTHARHPQPLTVYATKSGEFTRTRLRQAMQDIREGRA
jgi:hypothetical protein